MYVCIIEGGKEGNCLITYPPQPLPHLQPEPQPQFPPQQDIFFFSRKKGGDFKKKPLYRKFSFFFLTLSTNFLVYWLASIYSRFLRKRD